MKYRTNNLDSISRKKISLHTLMEVMLQNAFLTNYKVALGIIDSLETTDENDNKQLYAKCNIAIKKQVRVEEDGQPVFEDYPPIYARIIRFGNNWQNVVTPIIKKQLCILFFTDRPFDNAWTQESKESDPTTKPLTAYRAHNLGDALCIPIANDVALPEDLTVNGNLIVNGNLLVNGDIKADHIEAGDGATGEYKHEGTTLKFKGGICLKEGSDVTPEEEE